MDKIKKLLHKELKDIKILQDKEKKTIFLITIITSMIVHFQLYALMITGPDTLINSMYHQADIWEAMLLRFGLDFMQGIKGNIVSPILATLISSIFLGITVNLVIDILKIKNKYLKYITAIVFAVAPNISATLTFFYCSDAYLLGMLLATLSVYLIRKYEDKNWIIVISGLLIALAMGMYQTYLSVTMVLCVATLIIDILNNKDKKQIFINTFKYILMGIIGIILFYILSHITLLMKNLPASSYSGANTIGLKTLLELPQLLPEAYNSFFAYYFNDKMLPNMIWGTNIFYIIIFTIILISIIYIIIKNKIYKNITNTILVLIFIIIAPICFGIIEIMVPSIDIHILMACSMIYIFPIFFKILEVLPKDAISRIFKGIAVLCSLVIIWNYTWQDNASYIAIKSMQNQTEFTVARIMTQIEQLDEYKPETPVLFWGGLGNNEYLDRSKAPTEAKKIYNRTWGFISNWSTIWTGNLDSWRKILYEYIGVNVNLVSASEKKEILETEEFKNMKSYPEKDSIKIIQNTVIVKLSD
ncbi:MAG: hypothetical protein HFJ48_02165 [Clostridia bacterium]|nr:hypothetical protein [Clostridia bacterium]